ncbi:MAG: hypothetical protein Fur0015_09240 [Ignavibacteriales bacterium]
MSVINSEYATLAQLICDLTRYCSMKEEYFAASFNLSPTEVRFLKIFSLDNCLTIKEIKEKLGLTSGRITHILTSLPTKRLIERSPEESDKRNIIVRLLPNAAPLISNLNQNYNHLHQNILENINKEE